MLNLFCYKIFFYNLFGSILILGGHWLNLPKPTSSCTTTTYSCNLLKKFYCYWFSEYGGQDLKKNPPDIHYFS